MILPAPASPHHLPSLDGLRGLAALAVVFSHVAALGYVPWGDQPPSHAEFILWHLGAPAVDLFFVLSGLVVGRSLLRRPALLGYLKRRAGRLLPVAYLAVLLGGLARLAALKAGDGYSVLVTRDLTSPLSLNDLLGALTLTWPVLNANHLNPPLWSLVVELQAALLMPLLVRVARWPWISTPALLLITLILGLFIPQALFLLLFFLGALLARRTRILPRWALRPALLLGLGVLLQRHLSGSDATLTRWLTAPGAALLVVAVSDGAARRLLDHPAVQWLGRVSYSLYATHFPLLLALSVPLHRLGVPVTVGGLLAVPGCLLLAGGVHRWFEGPLLARLGREKRSSALVEVGGGDPSHR